MFGDDSDPTVTTERVGFGEVSDMVAREGSESWQEGLGGHGTVNEGRGFDALCKEGLDGLCGGGLG